MTVGAFQLLSPKGAVVFLILRKLGLHFVEVVLEFGDVAIASIDLVFEGVTLAEVFVV